MNENKKIVYKKKLITEKKEIENLLNKMSNSEFATELSFTDNHTGDHGSEIYDKSKNMALEKNESLVLKEIEDSLNDIDEGKYGICRSCKKEIDESRLDFIPYTKYCVKCQDGLNQLKPREINDRPVEEEIINTNTEFQYDEFFYEDENYVEPVEKFSNEDYKKGL